MSTQAASDAEVKMEDYALVRVPIEERKGWFDLSSIAFGFATSLFWFLIGGVTTFLAGFWMGLLACLIAAVFAFGSSVAISHIAMKEGMSCDLNSRAFGFGRRGSVIPSAVYAFMLIGFLGLETSIIGQAIMYQLGIVETLIPQIIIYVPLTAAWGILTLYGINWVVKVAQVAVPLMIVFLIIVIAQMVSGNTLGEATSHGVMIPGMDQWTGFQLALNTALGTALFIGLNSADFTRYARNTRSVIPFALVVGPVAYFIVPILGAITTYAAFPAVMGYFVKGGMPEAAAAELAIASPGMGFVILGGAIGLLLVISSQAKIQTWNSYGASLALANILAMGANWAPGRKWCLLIVNALALVFIFAGVLGFVQQMLTLMSTLGSVWAVIVMTDYYIVRKMLKLAPPKITALDILPAFNWVGIIVYLGSVVIAMSMYNAGMIMVPFFVAVPLGFVAYVVLSVATQGKFSKDAKPALSKQY